MKCAHLKVFNILNLKYFYKNILPNSAFRFSGMVDYWSRSTFPCFNFIQTIITSIYLLLLWIRNLTNFKYTLILENIFQFFQNKSTSQLYFNYCYDWNTETHGVHSHNTRHRRAKRRRERGTYIAHQTQQALYSISQRSYFKNTTTKLFP